MDNFAELILKLDSETKTNNILLVLRHFFENISISESDKLWVIYLLSGNKIKRSVNSTLLKFYAAEFFKIPLWLFEESYHSVGDLAETISLLKKDNKNKLNTSLSECIDDINKLNSYSKSKQKEKIFYFWELCSKDVCFAFNKLLTGGFRIGVSQSTVLKALSLSYDIDKSILVHKFSGSWHPKNISLEEIINSDISSSKPYPFYLASTLSNDLEDLGEEKDWRAEWKWDGIRAQMIFRDNKLFIWSRGQDLITETFPEFESLIGIVPNGTVIDGEILATNNDQNILSFNKLQNRLGKKNPSRNFIKENQCIFFAYDLIELNSKDLRNKKLEERIINLENILSKENLQKVGFNNFKSEKSSLELFNDFPAYSKNLIAIPKKIIFTKWSDLKLVKELSRKNKAEGLVLKKLNSTYKVGRVRGDWWKWKIDTLSIDGVLINAQKGHGRRADLYTDYTFGVWDENKLVPFAKAYSGLTDKEINEVNRFILKNTIEKFGPVRIVRPELVFEIGFEGILESSRHKSGVSLRFPRILRWRKDKSVDQADNLNILKEFLKINDS